MSAVVVVVVALVLIVTLVMYGCSVTPGVAFKVPYEQHPELQEIYDRFKSSCKVPALTYEYLRAMSDSVEYHQMREECKTLPDVSKYEDMETKELPNELKNMYKHEVSVGDDLYTSRLGSFSRTISQELETFTTEKINSWMSRLGLTNKLDRQADSRGASYMHPQGFMEWHSNQTHHAGWRLYFHYLPEDGESWFAYKHPIDGSYRRIADTNYGANMFRIRVKPAPLLWHCIYTEIDRFAWGIWLPPELAQFLKEGAECL